MPTLITPILVEPLWFPLVKKFYQAHYPSGKPNKADPIWVVKEGAMILAAVRIKRFDHCQLLTALVTHPEYRGQGYGQHLVKHLHAALLAQPSFCINQPSLVPFYLACGFRPTNSEHELPADIAGRVRRYRAKQPNLIVMQYREP